MQDYYGYSTMCFLFSFLLFTSFSSFVTVLSTIVFLDTYFLFLLKLIFISSDNKQQGKKQKYKM